MYSRRVSNSVTRFALIGLVLLFWLLLPGCAGPGYYLQAASGHWKLMKARQDVSEVISKGDGELAARLNTAQDILAFAKTALGLPAGDSYESYVETGREAVTWNVVATPEFSLEAEKWCFPVAGCVPYRGYFEQEKADHFATRLRARGQDVTVSPVTAYSTLGWFRDPLLDTMLQGPDMLLAATIIHELAHQRLYLKGDTTFNESYARFVEHEGVSAWLHARSQDDAGREWLIRHTAIAGFNHLLGETRQQLEAVYAADLGEEEKRRAKRGIFTELELNYGQLVDERWGGRNYFNAWFASEVNNAKLALFQEYEGGFCAFQKLFRQAQGNFEEFHRLAGKHSELGDEERRMWLAERC